MQGGPHWRTVLWLLRNNEANAGVKIGDRRDQHWAPLGRFLISFSSPGSRMRLLTFDFVLGLFSPPLELFAVVVEPLQAHDAILQAGAARTQDGTQPSGGLSIAGQVAWRDPQRDPLPSLLSMCPKDASVWGGSGQTQAQGKILAGNWGNSQLHQFRPVQPT